MLAKLFNKSSQKQHPHPQARVSQADLDPRIVFHYGIPSTASILALDRTQSLLAIGTLDGRIKVIGGGNIEGLLLSPKALAFKYLEFLENQGFLASVSSENEIQVWDLEHKQIAGSLKWECNITAFSVIYGTNYMYIGSEYAMVSLVKYDAEDRKIKLLPYYITSNFIAEAAGMSLPDNLSVVGVLHQPSSPGNRLLIAYENGLIILWDASQDRVVLVRGSNELQVKEETVHSSSRGKKTELSDAISDSKQVEKEMSSLCWVCDNGSTLAVGYIDGDIMFWDLSTSAFTKDHRSKNTANNVAKLQLSSDDKRLPVIVLHWSANRLDNHPKGQLFVYGGGGIGSEEVLSVLSVDWSSGIESLKCIGRVDLTLVGSFADMVLLPASGSMENGNTLLFTLTNQGQLHVYDKQALMSQQKKTTDGTAVQYSVFIPTTEPCITVAKLALLERDGKYSSALSKQVAVDKSNAKHTSKKGSAKWPLTGGVPSHLLDADNYHVERLYVAGYKDGSVRIWDATYPALSLIYAIDPEVKGIRCTSTKGTVSALEFCSLTLKLAIGDVFGMVRLYKLIGHSDETELQFVTKTEKEVHTSQQDNRPQCTAVFSIIESPICTLQYANFGARLAVGYECGRVAMLDISASSVLFLTDSVSKTSSPVICLYEKSFLDTNSLSQNRNSSESKSFKSSSYPENRMNPKDSEAKTVSDSGNGLASPDNSDSKNVVEPEHGMSVKNPDSKTLRDSGNVLGIPMDSESKNVTDQEHAKSVKDPESNTMRDSGNGTAITKDSESTNVNDHEPESKPLSDSRFGLAIAKDSESKTDPDHGKSVKGPESKTLSDSENGLVLIMTGNAHIVVLDSATGNMIRSWPMHPIKDSTAIKMYIIEDGDILCDLSNAKKHSSDSPHKGEAKHDNAPPNADSGGTQLETDPNISTKTAYFVQRLVNICVLLCCENTLHLCSLKSVIEGDSNSIMKVNLVKPCCWTSMFKKDGKDSGLVVLYQTGVFEIRSFPNLEVVREISLMTILRWNFMTNMDKTFCSSDRGQMILVKGCELAFVSLLAYEDDFRISESLPCLHDKVLAAATDVIANLSLKQKQNAARGILGGIIKGLKASKTDKNMDPSRATGTHEKYCANLESLFSNPPFLKPSTDVKDSREPVMLNLDDIVIDGPLTVLPKHHNTKDEKKDKGSEKKKLFEGATSDTKPKMRTAAEIKAKYRETGDVAEAAARAREMLAERQQKLEKLSENTEELASGAQDFASMAKELTKRMENRKWWQL